MARVLSAVSLALVAGCACRSGARVTAARDGGGLADAAMEVATRPDAAVAPDPSAQQLREDALRAARAAARPGTSGRLDPGAGSMGSFDLDADAPPSRAEPDRMGNELSPTPGAGEGRGEGGGGRPSTP